MKANKRFKGNGLFVGLTGSLGLPWALSLLQKGWFLVFLVRKKDGVTPEERAKYAMELLDKEAITKYRDCFIVLEGDLRHIPGMDMKIDAVFNASGVTSFLDRDKDTTFEANYYGVLNLIDYIDKNSIKEFHHVSTGYVYDLKQKTVSEKLYEPEKTFKNPYAQSKSFADIKIMDWVLWRKFYGDPCKVFVYRPTIIAGDSHTGLTTNFFAFYWYIRSFFTFWKMCTKNLSCKELHLPIHVPGSKDATINIVTVDYVVDMMIKIQEAGVPGIYNIANADPPNYEWLLKESLACFGVTGPSSCNIPEDTPSRLRRAENLICRGISLYSSFVISNQFFSQENAKRVLGMDFVNQPKITAETVKLLMGFAIEKNFK